MNPTQTVLIVDDDAALARIFQRVFSRAGYTALVATAAPDALRQLNETRIDAVILDLRMPIIDGFGLLYRLRSREAHQHLPVIIITGDTGLTGEQLKELSDLGATVRYKPIEVRELLAEVDRLLSRER
jgi:DNA-binding response OmpR family regulator